MIVAGLDLSMTGSGVCVIDAAARTFSPSLHRSSPGARVPRPAHKGRAKDKGVFPVWDRTARLRVLTAGILAAVPDRLDLAVVEAPSFASKGGFPHERSGLFWMVLTELERRCPIVEVPPTSRAKYATGSGAADKVSVVAATMKEYELSYRDNNLIDATVLAAMGCRHLGLPLEANLPEAQLDAMNGVLWPNTKG